VLTGCASDAADRAARRVQGGAATTSSSAATSTTSTTTATAVATCAKIPQETAGPYPGDGSNGPNILTTNGVVRSDIRSGIGTASGTANGVPLTVNLTIVDATTCKPRTGTAVYIWHCDINGGYSMYSQGVSSQNYLRGVQQVDANGNVDFVTIFPACYSGRWPHIHFEIFPSLAAATSGARA
jgi:protocatechuate 3,4-dioxygenase beta subunit